jgi:hypothetical protein
MRLPHASGFRSVGTTDDGSGDSAASTSAFAGIAGARWWTNEYGIEVRGSHPSAKNAEEWGSLRRGESNVGQPPRSSSRRCNETVAALTIKDRELNTTSRRVHLSRTSTIPVFAPIRLSQALRLV